MGTRLVTSSSTKSSVHACSSARSTVCMFRLNIRCICAMCACQGHVATFNLVLSLQRQDASTMEKKCDAQLSAKRQLLSDQLEVAKDHLETLRSKCNLVEIHSKRVCDFVSDRFTDLKHSLYKREKEVISKILVESSRIKEELNAAKKSAELIIDRSRQVRPLCMTSK